jgi:hypothetical protein
MVTADPPPTHGASDATPVARWRRAASAARRIVLHARTMSDDELAAAITQFRVGRVLAGPLAFAVGAVLLVIHSVLLLLTNWRLVALELFPALWLATVLWDWRFHVVYGNDLTALHGPWAIAIAGFVVLATLFSYWCNIAFAYAANGEEPTAIAALRRAGSHWRLVLVAGLAVGVVHAWVSVRGPIRGLTTFALGLGAVAIANLYLYSALPAQAIGLDRRRGTSKDLVTETITFGALSVIVSTPGIVLAVVARVLLLVPLLQILGGFVLAAAVVLQIAAASSSRAVSLSAKVTSGGEGSEPTRCTPDR